MNKSKVTSKLKKNDGVTILFALLLFLVASMVSVTILANAYNAVKRTHSSKEATQANITLDSAILLLKKNLNGDVYKVTATTDRNGKTNYSSGEFEARGDSTNLFEDEVKKVSQCYLEQTSGCSFGDFTISASNEEDVNVTTECEFGGDSGINNVTFALTTESSRVYVSFSLTKNVTSTVQNTQNIVVEWTYNRASGKDN